MFHYLTRNNFRFITLYIRQYSTSINSNLINILKTMPKDHKHILEVQKQRKKIKEKLAKYAPGRVSLQVLGTGAKGAPRSLYLFSDQSRYLFNCGEGTQRLAHEHKMKLAKLEHIFITQPVWRNIGGLPGTALTIQDVGVPNITLHGPPGLEEIFTATRRFVVIKEMQIRMAECNEDVLYEDNVMAVQYVPLMKTKACTVEPIAEESPPELNADDKEVQKEASTSMREEQRTRRTANGAPKSEIVEDDTDYYEHQLSGTREQLPKPSDTARLNLQKNKELGISMAYICRLQPRPGALVLDRCVELGVPAGPMLGKLKSGEDVELENGTIVRSKDVCEPDDPGPVFIVIDCPTEEYLDSVVNNDRFKKHQWTSKRDADLAHLVVHFTPKHVVEHPKYLDWIGRFSPSTTHLMLNESNTCMGSEAVHKIQYKLNLLDVDIFPLLGDNGTDVVEEKEYPALKRKRSENDVIVSSGLSADHVLETIDEGLGENIVLPGTFCRFHLRPKSGLDRSGELKLRLSDYLDETLSVDGFTDALETLKQSMNDESEHLRDRKYPRILFLGTGSCIPNKTRNTSAILVETSDEANILLDCGEGTYGQLTRFFGQERIDEVLANINAVYISHLHADHHIGLVGLLQDRRRAVERLKLVRNPVLLFAPKQILAWLNFYDTCFEDVCSEFELVPNLDLMLNDEKLSQSANIRICNTLGMKRINTTYVKHCPNAFGIAFTHKDGYKITYSGDTMPCESLVELGMDSDLLIHEATMEDELAQEAVIKMHSTTSQAITIGNQMRAKHIILTHFSQRYAKLPRFNDNFAPNVGIAFDNMQVRLDELPLLPLLRPALKLMFADHCEELEQKAVKRRLRREREVSRDRASSPERVAHSHPSANVL